MRQNDRFFHRVTTVNFSAAEITVRVVGYHSGANSRETPVLLLLFPA